MNRIRADQYRRAWFISLRAPTPAKQQSVGNRECGRGIQQPRCVENSGLECDV